MVSLSKKDRLYLFLSIRMGSCFPCKKSWKKMKKLQRLYEEGNDRIESELNIVKFMNNIRNFKIVLKHSLMDPKVKA